MAFRDIDFGKSDAHTEAVYAPALLLSGYYDDGIVQEALHGAKFLFLGQKGTGKSALGEHLSLIERDDLFVTKALLKDFPYHAFRDTFTPDNYATACSLVLLAIVFNSMFRDEGSNVYRDREFEEADRLLSQGGLLNAPKMASEITTARERKASLTIQVPVVAKIVVDWTIKRTNNPDQHATVRNLRTIASKFKTQSYHYIVLDGIDDIVLDLSTKCNVLAGFLFVVDEMNRQFYADNTHIKLIMLCRTDLFEMLASSNKNKIKQDFGYEINWCPDTDNMSNSPIIEVARLRARLSEANVDDVFSTYFDVEPVFDEGRTIIEYLLSFTRHTPRDFIQLLKKIQAKAPQTRVLRDHVEAGIRYYSTGYMLPEIKDELAEYASPKDIANVMRHIGGLKKKEFDLIELRNRIDRVGDAPVSELQKLLVQLFECSAIGNIERRESGIAITTWKFKNHNDALDLDLPFIVHRGLWKGLGLRN